MALALAVVVPALAMGGAAAWHAVGSYRAAFEAGLRDSARGLALAIDAEIDSHLTTLAALAASPLLDRGPASDLAAFYAHAKRAAEAVHAPVVVVGPDLAQLMTTERPFGEPLPRTNAADAVRAVFDTGRPVVSDLLVTAVTRRLVAVTAVPVLRDGRAVLVVLTRIEPERLADMLAAQVGASGDAFAVLTDARHRVVARSQGQARHLGAETPPEWRDAVDRGGRAGLARGPSLEGPATIFAFRRLDKAPGWTVGVAEPLAAYRASWQRPLLGLGLGGGVALLAAALGAAALGRRIILPVDALTRKAREVAANGGTLHGVPPSAVAEFEALRGSIAEAEATLRRRAEALAASERRHRSVVDTAVDAIVVICERAVVQSYNRAAEAIFGYAAEEVVGRNVSMLMDADLARRHDGYVDAYKRTGERRIIGIGREVEGRRKDGTSVPLDLSIAEWRDADGRRFFTGIMRDISARKRADAALRESGRRNREALERLGEALYALDAGYRVVFASRRALDTWGKRAEEVVGRRLDEVVPAVAGSAAWQTVRRGVEGGEESHLCDVSAVLGRWIEIDVYPVEGGGATVALRDIDDRRRAEIDRARAVEALAASERHYRALAEAGAAAHWRAAPDGYILASRGWEVLTGQTAEALRGDGWAEVVHPEERPAAMAAWREAVAAREPVDVDFRVRTRAGTWLWVRARGVPVRDARGEVVEWAGVVEDVDARKRAEAALHDYATRLRDLLATVDLASVFVRDLDGVIRFWSAGCERLYGWTAAEAVGRAAHDLLGTVFPVPRAEIEAALERDGEWSGELRHRTRGGAEVVVAARKVLRRAADGRPAQVMESVADVTALRHAEEALRGSEARFARAVEAARVGTWDWDPVADVMTGSSGREERLVGRPTGSIRDLASMVEAVHPEDRHIVREAVRRVLARETDIYEAEFRTLWPDGTVRWLRSVGRAVAGPDGAVRHMSGVSMDVTEQVEARRRRDLLAREVDHRAKNALSVVLSMLRLTPADEPRAFAAAVEARVAALARAHSLLAEEGWAGADLRAVAERELAPYAAGPGRGAAIALDGPPVPLVPAAVQPLGMVLHELATNAAKHGALSRPGGRVELRWNAGRRAGEDGLLHLRWIETGAPPIAGAPVRRGFGTRVIEATVRGQLGGSVERRWEPSGLVCEIAVPLGRVLAGNGDGAGGGERAVA